MGKLAKLIQSQLPNLGWTSPAEMVQKNIQNWLNSVPELGIKKEILESAIKENVTKIRKLSADSKSINPLQIDVNIIESVLNKLKESNLEMPAAFSRYSQTLLTSYATQAQQLQVQIGTIDNQFTQHVSSVTQHLCQSISALSVTASSVSDVIGSIQNLSKTVSEFKPTTEGVFQLTGTILTNVTKISGSVVQAKQDLDKLQEQLASLRKNPLQNKLDIYRTEADIKTALHDHKNKETALNTELQNIGQAAQLFASVIGAAGLHKEAQVISVVAQTGLSIAHTIANFGAIAAASGPLAPYVAIAGAVVTLFQALGVFGKAKPSAEQKLLEHISKQISQLAEHVDKRFDRLETMLDAIYKDMNIRFDRVETMIGTLHKDMHGRFDRIESMLEEFYKNTMKGFTALSKQVDSIEEAVKTIQATVHDVTDKLSKLDKKLETLLLDNYEQPYKTEKEEAKDLPKRYQNADAASTQHLLDRTGDLLEHFKIWSVTHAKSSSLAGITTDLDDRTVCKEIITNGNSIEYKINLLAAYARKISSSSREFNLVNPLAWADAVNNYLGLAEKMPAFVINGVHRDHCDAMIAEGQAIKDFIFEVRTNNSLFSILLNNYRESLREVLDATYEVILEDTAKEYPSEEITPEAFLRKAQAFELGGTLSKTLSRETTSLGDADPFRNAARMTVGFEAGIYNRIPTDYQWTKTNMPHLLVGNDPCVVFHSHAVNLGKNAKDACETLEVLNKKYATWNNICKDLEDSEKTKKEKIIPLLKDGAVIEKRKARHDKKLPHLQLMEKYLTSLDDTTLQSLISKIIAAKADEHSLLKIALNKLDTCYQLLTIFIALAFNYEYENDLTWRTFLQIGLWDSSNFKDYLNETLTTETKNQDFIALALQKNVFPSLDEFESLLLTAVFETQKQKQVVPYPLVDQTIEKLKQFKAIYLLEPVPQQQQNPNYSQTYLFLRHGFLPTGNNERLTQDIQNSLQNHPIGQQPAPGM